MHEVSSAVDSAGVTGLIGLAGFLYADVRTVDKLRIGMELIWKGAVERSDVFRDNLQDLLALLALGGIGVVSLGLTGAVTQESSRLMKLLGLADEAGYGVLTWLVGIALAVAVDVVIFLWLLRVVPSVSHPLRRLLPGALFGAAGFEVLKLLGGYYLTLISRSVTASAFGGAVGLLVWINLVARFAFFTAAWTATLRSVRSAPAATDRRPPTRAVGGRGRPRPAPATPPARPRARTEETPGSLPTPDGGPPAVVGAADVAEPPGRPAWTSVPTPRCRRGREAPVEQQRCLVGGPERPALGVHDAHHQPPPVALGGGDERVAGGVGEAGLPAERAGIAAKRVLGLDLVAGGAASHTGHLGRRRGQDGLGGRVRDQVPEDQRQVVGRGGLAGDVETGRRAGDGVVGADVLRCLVHRGDRHSTPPAARASAFAASLPDCRISARNSSDTGYRPPATSPTRLPSMFSSSAVPTTIRFGPRRGASVSRVRVLSVLAG